MVDWLEVIQTAAICLNGVLSLLMFFMILKLGSVILPPTQAELDEMENDFDEGDIIVYLRGKSPEEIEEILHTPVPPSSKGRRSKRRKK